MYAAARQTGSKVTGFPADARLVSDRIHQRLEFALWIDVRDLTETLGVSTMTVRDGETLIAHSGSTEVVRGVSPDKWRIARSVSDHSGRP